MTLPVAFPRDPALVGTKFYLYSRENRDDPVDVGYEPSSNNSNLKQFQTMKPLKVVVPGWMEDGFGFTVRLTKGALLTEVCGLLAMLTTSDVYTDIII